MNERPQSVGDLLMQTLNESGINQTILSQRMGRPRVVIGKIIHGRMGISAATALELEAALGISAEQWMSAQAACEIFDARQRKSNGKQYIPARRRLAASK